MGKRQHQKDKMYLTYTEWSQSYGGYKATNADVEGVKFKRLPFDHCCLTMVPFEKPFCDLEGNVFEEQPILDFLKHFKISPISGKPADPSTLIKLNFSKNHEGEFHCPTLFKLFTKNSHIVAIATTGNVFSYEAIEQLNLKTKNFKDLIDDTPFARKDIITIQDPNNLEKFNISTFHHVKKNLRIETEEELLEKKNPQRRLKTINQETKEILSQLERDYKPKEETVEEKKTADSINAAHYSTGAVAAGFTSTTMERVTVHEAAIVDEDEIRYERVKKKGYVRLQTNFGPLNLELHCDLVPRTCENFIKLCARGYYANTKFHRSIRNFMIQGGDPTGTGMGGKSIWDKKFEDEFKPNLSHSGRGILSMANSGPNSNGSQFFITFRSCRSLDGKHTVFGKLVGGGETLTDMEKVEVDNKDRPIEDIVIQKVLVFVDPYEEVDEQLAKERAEAAAKISEEEAANKASVAKKKKDQKLTVFREGVGKYLNTNAVKGELKTAATSSSGEASTSSTPAALAPAPPKKQKRYDFGGFSSW